MLGPENEARIQNAIKTHWFIYLAFTSAIIMYTVVLFMVAGNGKTDEVAHLIRMKQVFIAVSVIAAAAKFWIQARLLFAESSYRACANLEAIIGKYMSYNSIMLAICELPALLGLIITFMTMRFNEWWLFLVITAILFATTTPQQDKLRDVAAARLAGTS